MGQLKLISKKALRYRPANPWKSGLRSRSHVLRVTTADTRTVKWPKLTRIPMTGQKRTGLRLKAPPKTCGLASLTAGARSSYQAGKLIWHTSRKKIISCGTSHFVFKLYTQYSLYSLCLIFNHLAIVFTAVSMPTFPACIAIPRSIAGRIRRFFLVKM